MFDGQGRSNLVIRIGVIEIDDQARVDVFAQLRVSLLMEGPLVAVGQSLPLVSFSEAFWPDHHSSDQDNRFLLDLNLTWLDRDLWCCLHQVAFQDRCYTRWAWVTLAINMTFEQIRRHFNLVIITSKSIKINNFNQKKADMKLKKTFDQTGPFPELRHFPPEWEVFSSVCT